MFESASRLQLAIELGFQKLFQHWIGWMEADTGAGTGSNGARCIFMALSHEYDDRPGELRDAVVQSQRDWRDAIARAAQLCIVEKHFRPDVDPHQVAFEFVGIGMTYQQTRKLLADAAAGPRARQALDALFERCRVKRRSRTLKPAARNGARA